MKKTAVLLYDSFCNFEISPVLELLTLAEKTITVFGVTKQTIKSEDGLSVLPDDTIDHLDLAEMVGWDDNLSKPVEPGYIITGNIITSISYNFVKWVLAFGKMLGIDIPAKTFGLQ